MVCAVAVPICVGVGWNQGRTVRIVGIGEAVAVVVDPITALLSPRVGLGIGVITVVSSGCEGEEPVAIGVAVGDVWVVVDAVLAPEADRDAAISVDIPDGLVVIVGDDGAAHEAEE